MPQTWLLTLGGRHFPRDGSSYASVLDADELHRASTYVRPLDRERFLAGRWALRRLLGAHLGRPPREIELVREDCPGCGGPHGRPAVPGAPLHFSLSYAADRVLLAFARTPVGADIEAVAAPRAAATAWPRDMADCLHPGERAELTALAPEDRPTAFTRCWTRKEAYLKGTGAGLADGVDHIFLGCGPGPARPPGWTVYDIAVGEGFAAACAVRTGAPDTTRRNTP
ncbi:4'-phosphopantetheinyl transferase family protein [Streptomyces sp. NPDC058746]|uniref:4'-phosphopantetheinyl transferase family protein n=1 Tax=Streptomyces sp. NPDC058746 TaxID=3346622 RepID=UPI0036C6614E